MALPLPARGARGERVLWGRVRTVVGIRWRYACLLGSTRARIGRQPAKGASHVWAHGRRGVRADLSFKHARSSYLFIHGSHDPHGRLADADCTRWVAGCPLRGMLPHHRWRSACGSSAVSRFCRFTCGLPRRSSVSPAHGAAHAPTEHSHAHGVTLTLGSVALLPRNFVGADARTPRASQTQGCIVKTAGYFISPRRRLLVQHRVGGSQPPMSAASPSDRSGSSRYGTARWGPGSAQPGKRPALRGRYQALPQSARPSAPARAQRVGPSMVSARRAPHHPVPELMLRHSGPQGPPASAARWRGSIAG